MARTVVMGKTPLSELPALAERVHGLWEVRAQLKQAEAVGEQAQRWLQAYASHEVLAVARKPVIEVRTVQRKPYRRFNTDGLKRTYPKIYEACRVLMPQYSVKHQLLTPDVPDFGAVLPDVPPGHSLADLTEVPLSFAYAEKLRIRPIVNDLKHREEQYKAQIETVVAEYLDTGRWDGLPFTFADGWTVQVRIRKFDKDLAEATLAPELVKEFSMIVPGSTSTQIVAVGAGERRNAGGPDANPFEGD